jgi:hypothetical protein
VQAGAINCYYVTHVLNGIESVPSTFFVNAKTGSTAIVTPGPNASSGGTATPQ